MSTPNNTVTMDRAAERNLLDGRRQGLVGKPIDRADGPAKVSGLARYSYEQDVANCAYGFVLSSEVGFGRVAKIDAEAARAAPGVIAVIVDHPLLPSDSGTVHGCAEDAARSAEHRELRHAARHYRRGEF